MRRSGIRRTAVLLFLSCIIRPALCAAQNQGGVQDPISTQQPLLLTGTNDDDDGPFAAPTASYLFTSGDDGEDWDDEPWPTSTAIQPSGTDSGGLLSGDTPIQSRTKNPSTFTITASKTGVDPPVNTQPCNLYVEFCTRKYSNITYIGAHNSMFAKEKNSASNQELTVTQQLNDGIRMLQGQTHVKDNVVHFCHNSCDMLDAGPAVDYFSEVNRWLLKNPFEVITLVLGNGDRKDVRNFTASLEASGLAKLAFRPKPKKGNKFLELKEWPTLGEMILMGQRVVIFMDYNADLKKVDYIIDEFAGTMWETKFSPTDPNFPCKVDRPAPDKQKDPAKRLILANHNLNVEIKIAGSTIFVPDVVQLNVTNNVTGFGSLGKHVDDCAKLWHRNPNFLLVDFYNRGNGSVFEVAAKANNVTYKGGCCGRRATTSSGSSIRPYFASTMALIIALFMIML